jgi:hypothetical protein
MRNRFLTFSTLALGGVLISTGVSTEVADTGYEGPVKKAVVLSDVFLIDRFYRSMEGPLQTQKVKLDDKSNALLWVKRITAEVVDRENKVLSHQDFFCHFNIDHVIASRTNFLPTATIGSHRLATMSQGQMAIFFPPNTGIPIHSQEDLVFYFQVLNRQHPGTFYVRHRITIEYIEDAALKMPLLPLFAHAGMVIKSVDPKVRAWNEWPQEKICGSCCPLSVGDRFPTGMGYIRDSFGHNFASHWKVEPGHSECATPLHSFMPLPYTTTLLAMSAHVHPYAQWLKLVDTRTKQDVFVAKVKTEKDAPILEEIDFLTYPLGSNVVLEAAPVYEMAVAYDNPTAQDQDAMAMAVFYMHDRRLRGAHVMDNVLLELHRKQPSSDIGGCALIPAFTTNRAAVLTLPTMK